MAFPAALQERNQDATLYVGDLDIQVSEAVLWELMLQAGTVVNVHIPKDKVTGLHSGYGFVEFLTEDDADYAIKVMSMIKLYGKSIRINKASQDKKTLDVGANLFIGNLSPEVDEKLLYDTFSTFGVIISTPKIMKDTISGESKGYAFVSYDSFESSDAAIASLNGQYLGGKPISVTYALKKDSKADRHGSAAERLLAANNPNSLSRRQAAMFTPPPIPTRPTGGPVVPMMPMMMPGYGMAMPGMGMQMPGMYPPPPPGYMAPHM